MDEILKAQQKVAMDAILALADCIRQADYIKASDVLGRAQGVLDNLNFVAGRENRSA